MRKEPLQEDHELIKDILRGEVSAFEKLIDKYQSPVFNLAMKFTDQNRELAEEITQDVFVKVFKKIDTYKHHSKFTTWLYRIVFTTSMSELRKNDPLVIVDDFADKYDNLASVEDWDLYVKDNNVLKIEMNKAINSLPKLEGLIVSLYYFNEQSIDEIGAILNMTSTAVKVKLFRVRKKIKKILSPKMEMYN